MKHLKKLEEEVSAWPQASVRPHRFGGKEFPFGSTEIGHVHVGGVVDTPFPRPIRDALLAEGLAEEHHWGSQLRLDHFPSSERGRSQALRLAHAAIICALRAEDCE